MAMSFEPKFTLGNVLTMGMILAAAVSAFYKQSLDTESLKTKIAIETGQTETKMQAMKIELLTQIGQLQTQLAVTISKMEGLQKDVDGIDGRTP
jgi:hypothetical protein